MAKRFVPPPVEEVEPTSSDSDMHLYKVIYRRRSSDDNQSKMRSFVTFGSNETDAIARVWETYRGSSFHRDFSQETASAEFIIGGVLKVGGN